jgi:hypothetical protein
MRFGRIIVLLAAMTLALSACSGGDIAGNIAEEVLEGQEGVGDVEIDENNGSVQIEVQDEDGDGSVIIGGGQIPDDFPIPVPDGGTVAMSISSEEGSSLTVSYPISEYDSLVSTYQRFVDDTGGDVTTLDSSNPRSKTWSVTTETESYYITVGDADPDVIVSIIVGTN